MEESSHQSLANDNDIKDFHVSSPQQLLDDHPSMTYMDNENNRLLFASQYSLIPPEQQTNIVDGKYRLREYRSSNNVNSDFLGQNDLSSLHHSLDSHPFQMMFDQPMPPSFPQEDHTMEPAQQFMNYNQHHRASLPAIHSSDLLPPTVPIASKMEPDSAKSATPYARRYTEGSIPAVARATKLYTRKQRMDSTGSSSKGEEEDDEESKRKQFLERNRQAALKCRQRKKQWLANLQHRVEFLATDNEQLQSQATMLREEVLNLKTLLLAHRDCKVAQANGATVGMIESVSGKSTTPYNYTNVISVNNNMNSVMVNTPTASLQSSENISTNEDSQKA